MFLQIEYMTIPSTAWERELIYLIHRKKQKRKMRRQRNIVQSNEQDRNLRKKKLNETEISSPPDGLQYNDHK